MGIGWTRARLRQISAAVRLEWYQGRQEGGLGLGGGGIGGSAC